MSGYARLSDGTTVPVTPEPFWYCGWRTLFLSRPACYQCRTIFMSMGSYEEHHVKAHLEPEAQEDKDKCK